jgi:cobaltochelatase CobN
VKNLPDREIDMIDMDDVYGYLGGLNAFVKTYGRKDAVSYMGDSSDPNKTTVRFTGEELKFVFRRKVLNPKFIEGLKEHGFRGVGEISKMTDYIFGWDATSEIVEKWMYDGLAEKYLLDEETAAWMERENPHAMMDIIGRLLEAFDRGMWDADEDMIAKLRDLYLRLEGEVEDGCCR